MTKHLRPLADFDRSGRSLWLTLLSGLMLVLVALHAVAQAPPAPAANPMDDLVGRIALYPDDLVAVILPASTSPLQIVQADRYLEKRKTEPKLPLDDKWDDAVKTLLNYPTIVKMMSNDLDWTSALGEAVVADQGAVLDGVQSFRRRAQAAGNLKSDDKQVVKAEKEIIIIEPANPEVIYVPQYTPSTVIVYGTAPVYGYYPAPYPSYYYPYPPGAALATGLIWGAAIGAAWNGGRWGANYGGGDINIDIDRNTNIDRSRDSQRSSGKSSTSWKSGKQPGQVSSSVGKSSSAGRPGDARGGAGAAGAAGGARASTQPGGGAAGAGGARASTQPGGGGAAAGGGNRASAQPGGGSAGGGASRPGTQQSGPSSAGRGGDAFGGYSSGRQTHADSSRGASSRSSMSGGGRSAGGGGARGGGGGGRGGGGRR